jgi:ATP-binding cassette subfamily B protein
MTTHTDPDSKRFRAAFRLAVYRYARQIRMRPFFSSAALLLPGIADILLMYAPTLVVARLLESLSGNQSLTARDLSPYILLIAGLWLTGELLWRLAMLCISRTEIRAIESLYIEAMDDLLARDIAFFQDNFAGSLTKRSLGYARRFEDVFDALAFQVALHVVPLAFVAVVLWSYSPYLILALFGMLSLTVAFIFPLIRRRQRLVDIREAASNVVAGHVADSIANAEAVRAFAREPDEARIHAANVRDYGGKTLRSWDYQNLRVETITAPMYVLTNTLGLVIALVTGAGTGAGLAAIFVTFTYFSSVTRVMWEFNRIYRNLEGALADAAQFTELLIDPPKVIDIEKPDTLAPAHYGVEMRDVLFRYSPTQPLLFNGFSLNIEPGTRVGLVGRSGGGKTTITRLLLRFMDIEGGTILLGGQQIDKVPQTALRELIGYVPQDPAMFHRSIADNIRFGKPHATETEIRCAAELAHAADFIEMLPQGYQTLVGERGVKLSGGQRQRVAIARAILKDAPILILDEATSSLDSESEALIQDALWNLMARRTAIVIAHRLSTVRRMDELVVLERGAIVERGSHEELLALGGIYASLWAHQSGGFLQA